MEPIQPHYGHGSALPSGHQLSTTGVGSRALSMGSSSHTYRERERQRETDRDRQTDREIETERQTDRQGGGGSELF